MVAGVSEMPCYHPLRAFQLKPGAPLFFGDGGRGKSVQVPCGQCVGCRLEYSRQWGVRCMHEARMHEANCFLTLTYDDAHVPKDLSLRPADFTEFFKRLRERLRRNSASRIKYFMCGEYGGVLGRPHYHAIVFGYFPVDSAFFKKSKSGYNIYTSKELDADWQRGIVFVGDVSFKSACYVARYVMKKTDQEEVKPVLDVTTGEIIQRVNEYARMSRKPGIGRSFVQKFGGDVYNHDRVVVEGSEIPVPRYYQNLLKESDPELFELNREKRVARGEAKQLKLEQEWKAKGLNVFDDVRRLAVEEVVKVAQIKSLTRE